MNKLHILHSNSVFNSSTANLLSHHIVYLNYPKPLQKTLLHENLQNS